MTAAPGELAHCRVERVADAVELLFCKEGAGVAGEVSVNLARPAAREQWMYVRAERMEGPRALDPFRKAREALHHVAHFCSAQEAFNDYGRRLALMKGVEGVRAMCEDLLNGCAFNGLPRADSMMKERQHLLP